MGIADMNDDWRYKQNLKCIYNLISKDLNATDKDGETALMWAASYHTDIAKALIYAGAEINVQNKNGKTALYLAAAWGNLELVKILLDAGADPALQDEDGYTALVYPAKYNHIEIVKLLADAMYKRRANNNGFEIEAADKAIVRKQSAAKLYTETAEMKNAIMEKISGLQKKAAFRL